MRRTAPIALLATILCVIALIAAPTASAATGHHAVGSHAIKIVPAQSGYQRAPDLRFDQPQLFSSVDQPRPAAALGTATATSATITTSRTVDSPRMRGPPAHGCF